MLLNGILNNLSTIKLSIIYWEVLPIPFRFLILDNLFYIYLTPLKNYMKDKRIRYFKLIEVV
jgi:hypothetical protein